MEFFEKFWELVKLALEPTCLEHHDELEELYEKFEIIKKEFNIDEFDISEAEEVIIENKKASEFEKRMFAVRSKFIAKYPILNPSPPNKTK